MRTKELTTSLIGLRCWSSWQLRRIAGFLSIGCAIGLLFVMTSTRLYVDDYSEGILFLAVAGALAFVFFRRRKLALVASGLSCILSLGIMAGQKQDRQPVKQKAERKAGVETYRQYCASCHGKRGKGDGPVAEALKISPSDLTALARTYDGKFPRGYVLAVLIFGKRVTSHGSDDMPVWGARFRKIDPEHDRSGQKHIDDLVAYLESIQAE